MRLYCYLFITILCIATTQSSIYSNLKNNVLYFLQRSINEYAAKGEMDRPKQRHFTNVYTDGPRRDRMDARAAKEKAKIIKRVRNVEKRLNNGNDGKEVKIPKYSVGPIGNKRYQMDPVLNFMRRGGQDFRRNAKRKRKKKNGKSASEPETSSSMELANWKEEWEEHWLEKKFEAVNSSIPRGDVVNMVAARPWGAPCGDPNQHDMPWGSCMMPMECDAEYRIYRGDYFCGRTSFVCCALQYTNYDMNQGFDMSFDDTSFSTDSSEKGKQNSKENKKGAKKIQKRKRERERTTRKRTIKRTIKRIIREMQKILNRAYRNGTSARKKKTKQLKKYIQALKKKYRKERKAIREIHEIEMIKIDSALQRRLEQIRDMNKNFMANSTFRDIVVNGTITKQGARMLVEAYPDLENYMDPRLMMRRSGGGEVEDDWEPNDYLEYDIEYGLVYS